MSRRDHQGVIAQNRCYIRKPGPMSEEPQTSQEWRILFDRCVRAGRDELLDAIRTIVNGSVEAQTQKPNALDELQEFSSVARDRWQELVSTQPANSPTRFRDGYYEMAFSLVGAEPVMSLNEIQIRLNVARQVKLSGWTPFLELVAYGRTPYAYEDFVEAWAGHPDHEGRNPEPSYLCDFWRVSLDGKLYTIRGYAEDGQIRSDVRMLYPTSMIWRIGEGLLFVSRFAKSYGVVDQIAVYCRFTGLKGRCICTHPGRQELPIISGIYNSSADEVTLTMQVTLQQIQDNLAEVLHPFLQRLYEKFSFSNYPLIWSPVNYGRCAATNIKCTD